MFLLISCTLYIYSPYSMGVRLYHQNKTKTYIKEIKNMNIKKVYFLFGNKIEDAAEAKAKAIM